MQTTAEANWNLFQYALNELINQGAIRVDGLANDNAATNSTSTSAATGTMGFAEFASSLISAAQLTQHTASSIQNRSDTIESQVNQSSFHIQQLQDNIATIISDPTCQDRLSHGIDMMLMNMDPIHKHSLPNHILSSMPINLLTGKIASLQQEKVAIMHELENGQFNRQAMLSEIHVKQQKLTHLLDSIKGSGGDGILQQDLLRYSAYAAFLLPMIKGVSMSNPYTAAAMIVIGEISSILSKNSRASLQRRQNKINNLQHEINAKQNQLRTQNAILGTHGEHLDLVQGQLFSMLGQRSTHATLLECQNRASEIAEDNEKINDRINKRNDQRNEDLAKNKDRRRKRKISYNKYSRNRNEINDQADLDIEYLESQRNLNDSILKKLPTAKDNPVAMGIYKNIETWDDELKRKWGLDNLSREQDGVANAVSEAHHSAINYFENSPMWVYMSQSSALYCNAIRALALSKNMDPIKAQHQIILLSSIQSFAESSVRVFAGCRGIKIAFNGAIELLKQQNIPLTPLNVISETRKLLTKVGGPVLNLIFPIAGAMVSLYQLGAILGNDIELDPTMSHIRAINETMVTIYKELHADNVRINENITALSKLINEQLQTQLGILANEFVKVHSALSLNYYRTSRQLYNLSRRIDKLGLDIDIAIKRSAEAQLRDTLSKKYNAARELAIYNDSYLLNADKFKKSARNMHSLIYGVIPTQQQQNQLAPRTNITLTGRAFSAPFNQYSLRNPASITQHLKDHDPWYAIGLIALHTMNRIDRNYKLVPSPLLAAIAASHLEMLVTGSKNNQKNYHTLPAIQEKIRFSLQMLDTIIQYIQKLRSNHRLWHNQLEAIAQSQQSYDSQLRYSEAVCNSDNDLKAAAATIDDLTAFNQTVIGYQQHVYANWKNQLRQQYYFPRALTLETVTINGIKVSLLDLMSLAVSGETNNVTKKIWKNVGNHWAAIISGQFTPLKTSNSYYETDYSTVDDITSFPLLGELMLLPRSVIRQHFKKKSSANKEHKVAKKADNTTGLIITYQHVVAACEVSVSSGENRSAISLLLDGKELFTSSAKDENSRYIDCSKQIEHFILQHRENIAALYKDTFASEDNYNTFEQQHILELIKAKECYLSWFNSEMAAIEAYRSDIETLSGSLQALLSPQIKAQLTAQNILSHHQAVIDAHKKLEQALASPCKAIAYMGEKPKAGSQQKPIVTFHGRTKATKILMLAAQRGIGRYYGVWTIKQITNTNKQVHYDIHIDWYSKRPNLQPELYAKLPAARLTQEMYHLFSSAQDGKAERVFNWHLFLLLVFTGSKDIQLNAGVLSCATTMVHGNYMLPVQVSIPGLQSLLPLLQKPLLLDHKLLTKDSIKTLYDIANGLHGNPSSIKEKLESGQLDAIKPMLIDDWETEIMPATHKTIVNLIQQQQETTAEAIIHHQNEHRLPDLEHNVTMQKQLLSSMVGLFKPKGLAVQQASSMINAGQVDRATIINTTIKHRPSYTNILSQHSIMSQHSMGSALKWYVNSLPNPTHWDVSQSRFGRLGFINLMASIYRTSSEDLVNLISQQLGHDINCTSKTLSNNFLQQVCEIVYARNRNDNSASSLHNCQFHIVKISLNQNNSKYDVVNYVFGSTTGTPSEPKPAKSIKLDADNLLHIVCHDNYAWVLSNSHQANPSPRLFQ